MVLNPLRIKAKELHADLKHKENIEAEKEIYSMELHSNKNRFY